MDSAGNVSRHLCVVSLLRVCGPYEGLTTAVTELVFMITFSWFSIILQTLCFTVCGLSDVPLLCMFYVLMVPFLEINYIFISVAV
ncbi:uncharacterized protein F5891DRAFT_46105 [Suillus fuscotomentosus]|uniref:Uncharacterized protein n=1 Tax=Suillus fuscotomentosus TaxID=1912939 RepID=A0AAD4DUE5_9AGAM|nr:uncharacterized protein F5891DRAFT_46105 [Suillus fuscotomentosus]KAG1893359.1 hypothetical protein F5891DRAFT_46105 [Suillus fuscotomentosus]